MSDYTKLTKSPKSALLYYYITNGLEFILSVAVYVIFYFIWLRFEWPHYLLYILLVLGALSTLKLFIKPLWQYHCRFYKVDQLSVHIVHHFLYIKKKRVELNVYNTCRLNLIQLVKCLICIKLDL